MDVVRDVCAFSFSEGGGWGGVGQSTNGGLCSNFILHINMNDVTRTQGGMLDYPRSACSHRDNYPHDSRSTKYTTDYGFTVCLSASLLDFLSEIKMADLHHRKLYCAVNYKTGSMKFISVTFIAFC